MTVIPRISVAMGTYNGGRHLALQLKTLAEQHYLPYQLVVCDDGSTDDTIQILDRFRTAAPFPVHIHINDSNLGFADNFLKAATLCDGDWVAFCDQDDLWLPNRLSSAAEAIENNPDALLILQNAYLSDAAAESRGRLFPNRIKPGYYGPGSQYGFWVWLGFLQTFSARLVQEFPLNPRPRNYFAGHDVQSHDKWTCMMANALGGIIVLEPPAALYRRHNDALTGAYVEQSSRARIDQSLQVNATHYTLLADAARSYAQYLRRISNAASGEASSSALLEAAKNFDILAATQSWRSKIYSTSTFFARLRCFGLILASGGYWGPPVTAMGSLSAIKDLLSVFGLLNLIRPKDPHD